MEYHQPTGLLCHPYTEQINLGHHSFVINYVDRLDNSALEFPHYHTKFYEIYYIEQGPVLYDLDDQRITLNTGDLLLLNKGTKHCSLYTPQIPKRYFVMVFDIKNSAAAGSSSDPATESEDRLLSEFEEFMQDRPYALTRDRFNTGGCIEKLQTEVLAKEFGWEFIARSHYTNFIILTMRNFLSKPSQDKNLRWNNLPIAITKYLHANYYNAISIQDVADYFHITPRHVTRVFKDYFGSSLSKTLTLYRLNYAKNYLIDTDYSLEQIAEEIGLSSASSLSKLFKEVEGMSITEYRRKIADYKEQQAQE
ncbi:MAG: AraC family transcriptional regulator [Eubacteriales bacterium]|nr:AraC family transcriptional regulator [Eubacteriales bacterium]